ncbi:MAG: ABC transporter ATP-binding protein [Deltaproteobacteria bacterium]|nr:ABC transporter ATP-binding protein [Deltaproteobacteria bacterium]
MSAALELQGLTKRFGGNVAVDALALSVPEGSLFGLIGPNGAGKTTTFSLIAGFLRADSGEIRVRGEILRAGRPRNGQALVLPQDASLPPRVGALDALVMLARLGGLDRARAVERGRRALERLGLGAVANKAIGILSHGQRRRVAIAQALLGDREVILLDEPTAGLDPLAAAELRELIKDLHQERTIVLSSHNLAEVEALCDHAAILDRGRLVSIGSMDELRGASSLARLELSSPPADLEGLLAALRGIPGVRQASRVDAEPSAIALELSDDGRGSADRAASEVLRRLLELGVQIRSMERGKSLEQRFLEETRRS